MIHLTVAFWTNGISIKAPEGTQLAHDSGTIYLKSAGGVKRSKIHHFHNRQEIDQVISDALDEAGVLLLTK